MGKGSLSYDNLANGSTSGVSDVSFKGHVWSAAMDTSSSDLVQGFFAPALSNAVRYDRAVGYFSSGWLRGNARGMLQFATNGGRGRWVTSTQTEQGQSSVSYDGRHWRDAILGTGDRASKPPPLDE